MNRLENIDAFVQAAELGSFTKAAKKLGITPSALSRRIAQLESDLGVRLFHRSTRALRLSDEGRAFFERARVALRDLADAQHATGRTRQKPAGLLRVEGPTILGRDVLVPVIAQYVGKHPEVDVELVLRDVGGDLVSEGIDVAVRMGALPDSSLIGKQIGRVHMLVCGASSYLRRRGTPSTVDDLDKHERLGFAVQGRSIAWRLRDGDAVRELPPTRRIVVNSADALIQMAIEGVGLVWICDFMKPRGRLVEVLRGARCADSAVNVVSLPTRHVLPKVRVFVDMLSEALAKRGS